MNLWLGIMLAIDMFLTSKELFLKLAGLKKQAKSLKATFCGVVNEKHFFSAQNSNSFTSILL